MSVRSCSGRLGCGLLLMALACTLCGCGSHGGASVATGGESARQAPTVATSTKSPIARPTSNYSPVSGVTPGCVGAPATGTPKPPKASGGVRRATHDCPLLLANNDIVDLDSMNPAWDRTVWGTQDSDFYLFNGTLVGIREVKFAVVSGAAGYTTCRKASHYVPKLQKIERRAKFCVRTSDKRLAAISIENIDKSNSDRVAKAQLGVVVWEKHPS